MGESENLTLVQMRGSTLKPSYRKIQKARGGWKSFCGRSFSFSISNWFNLPLFCVSPLADVSAPVGLFPKTLPKGGKMKKQLTMALMLLGFFCQQKSFATEQTDGTSAAEPFASVGLPGSPDAQKVFSETLRDLVTPDSSLQGGNLAGLSGEQLLALEHDSIRDTLDLLEATAGDNAKLVNLNALYSQDAAASASTSSSYGLFSAADSARRPRMSALSCLATAIEGEAGGEPLAGKRAVAQTIMDRAGGSAGRVCAVIFAAHQFESMDKRHLPAPSAECMQVAREALGSHEGKSCGFDYFIAKSLQRALHRQIPDWVRDFQRRGCLHKRIGEQDYYSSCNCKR
jgi:Cell Wall Hydrolase